MLVVDASALVDLLLGEADGSLADEVEARDLHAPALVDVEVLSVLRRLRLSPARGNEAVADLLDLPLTRYSHEALVPRAWGLKENFTAYDATYVALAEELAAPLMTMDIKLARAVRRHTEVDVLLPR